MAKAIIDMTGNFKVGRMDGEPIGGSHLVLDLERDPAAKEALYAYSRGCRKANPALSKKLRDLALLGKSELHFIGPTWLVEVVLLDEKAQPPRALKTVSLYGVSEIERGADGTCWLTWTNGRRRRLGHSYEELVDLIAGKGALQS